MSSNPKTVLVLGATGQQGGAVARALLGAKWNVRAFVRSKSSKAADQLQRLGAEVVQGDLDDVDSIRSAMGGVHGVFSVQPSSGQGAAYGTSDDDEIRWGTTVADVAVASGVDHLVYTSVNAAGPKKTGMGHFDSKATIEEHIRALPLRSTIIRPSGFMEILMLPGYGLERGTLNFIMRPDKPMQCIAVADIGMIVEAIFAKPETYGSRTFEIAGDALTGTELAETLSRAAGKPISYQRLPDSFLADNAFLAHLAALLDEGRLAGRADIASLRQEFPGLQTMEAWLQGDGAPLLRAALDASAAELSLR